MNLLSKLPFLKPGVDAEAADDNGEEAKRERIKYHREHVRVGPRATQHVTNGQVKRARKRALAGMTKKARRNQIQNYFETQRLASTVRAHLQHGGVLPFVHERTLDLNQQVVSVAWIVQRFGQEIEVELDGEMVKTGEMSFQEADVRLALEAATKFVSQASGQELSVPADYVVPVYAEARP